MIIQKGDAGGNQGDSEFMYEGPAANEKQIESEGPAQRGIAQSELEKANNTEGKEVNGPKHSPKELILIGEDIDTPPAKIEGQGEYQLQNRQGENQSESEGLIHTDSESETDGPPPGFLGPPKFCSPVLRRSPRLSQKNTGPYVTPEERARRVSKPRTVSVL